MSFPPVPRPAPLKAPALCVEPGGRQLVQLLHHGLTVAVVNTVVGLVLGFVGDETYLRNLVYSHCLGTCTWLVIDLGRFALRPDPYSGWPQGWRMVVLISGGTMVGFIVGHAIGDLLFDGSPLDPYLLGRRNLGKDLAITAVIGAMISGFYYHRGRTAYHLAKVAQAERDATLARLDMLRSQLEPHMLFNTLANLRVLIGIDAPRAQLMLDRLIAFLRATLNASRSSLHPLGDEFERLADYLALMALRMGPRLTLQFDLPAELRRLPVPPLLLQPLIENAIRHGLEPKVAGGRIVVAAQREGERLRLTVRDTGVGLDEARASHSGDGSPGGGFGIDHVRERLATLFGDQAQFSVACALDGEGGTVATITLPMPPPPGATSAP